MQQIRYGIREAFLLRLTADRQNFTERWTFLITFISNNSLLMLTTGSDDAIFTKQTLFANTKLNLSYLRKRSKKHLWYCERFTLKLISNSLQILWSLWILCAVQFKLQNDDLLLMVYWCINYPAKLCSNEWSNYWASSPLTTGTVLSPTVSHKNEFLNRGEQFCHNEEPKSEFPSHSNDIRYAEYSQTVFIHIFSYAWYARLLTGLGSLQIVKTKGISTWGGRRVSLVNHTGR